MFREDRRKGYVGLQNQKRALQGCGKDSAGMSLSENGSGQLFCSNVFNAPHSFELDLNSEL